MKEVRRLLHSLEEGYGDRLGDHLANRSLVLRVDQAGHAFIKVEDTLVYPVHSGVIQIASVDLMVDLLAEYEPGAGLRGPHLLVPRPLLRIVPGKLGGEPHVADTRIETRALMALANRGYETSQLLEFYPFLDAASVDQAVDLERQLNRNLTASAA